MPSPSSIVRVSLPALTVAAFCAALSAQAPFRDENAVIAEIPQGTSLHLRPPPGSMAAQNEALRVCYEHSARPRWSPCGEYVGFVAKLDEGGEAPVSNDIVGRRYDFVSGPKYARAGGPGIFRVGRRSADDRREKWWVWRDGKHIAGPFDWIGAIGVSPNGKTLAFWTQPGAKIQRDGTYNQGRLQMWFGGRKVGRKVENALALSAPVFTADGKKCFTVATKAGRDTLMRVDRRRITPLEASFDMFDEFATDSRGRRTLAAGCSMAAYMREVPQQPAGAPPSVGKEPFQAPTLFRWGDGEPFDTPPGTEAVGGPVFGPKDRRVAYRFTKDEKIGVAVDDRVVVPAEYDWVGRAVFGPRGKRLAVVVASDCELGGGFSLVSRSAPSVAPGGDARLIVVELGKKPEPVVIGGRGYERMHGVTWSPDGTRVAFVVRDADRQHDRLLLAAATGDATSSQPIELAADPVIGDPIWSRDGNKIGFGAMRDSTFHWCSVDAER